MLPHAKLIDLNKLGGDLSHIPILFMMEVSVILNVRGNMQWVTGLIIRFCFCRAGYRWFHSKSSQVCCALSPPKRRLLRLQMPLQDAVRRRDKVRLAPWLACWPQMVVQMMTVYCLCWYWKDGLASGWVVAKEQIETLPWHWTRVTDGCRCFFFRPRKWRFELR